MDAETKLLAHLQSAGEFLRAGKTDEASREIAQALRLAPRDVRALNLLGLLHFQGGRMDEAHTVYTRLLSEHPGDATLRLNLGLCELRRGKPDQAVVHLALVARNEPDNTRVQSYYGLALFRAGLFAEARPILAKAGQHDLVAEVDAKLGGQPVESVSVEKRGPQARPPRVAEPVVEEKSVPCAPSLADLLAASSLGEAPSLFSLTRDGLLLIRIAGQVSVRGEGVLACVGALDFLPFSDEDARAAPSETTSFFSVDGRGELLLSAQGGRFSVLSLADGEALFLRRAALVACVPSLLSEDGAMSRSDGSPPAFFLKGPGELVLRSPSLLHSLPVRAGQNAYFDETGVVAWTTGVAVSHDVTEDNTREPHVVCSGYGHVLFSQQLPPNQAK